MPTTTLEPEVVTQYRCRLYRHREETFPGEHLVTDVRDEIDRPTMDIPSETKWELIGTFIGSSEEETQRQVELTLTKLGNPPRGSWAGRGMI